MLSVLLLVALADAAEPDYVRDVHPILQAHCGGCHNADDAQGGFNVDTFTTLAAPLSELTTGPSFVAGQAETSQFYRYMAGLDQPRMPPEGDGDPVPESELAVVRTWLDAGAHGPADAMIDRTALVVPQIDSQVADESLPITAMAGHGALVAEARGRSVVLSRRESDGSLARIGSLVDVPGQVNDLEFSADGLQLLVATGVEGVVGRALVVGIEADENGTLPVTTQVEGHRDTLYAVALSPDGTTLATAGYDRRIELWNATNGQPLRTLEGHNGALFDLAFDSRGRVLASASADETVKLWRVADGERLDTLPQPEGEQTAVAIVDDRFVFAAGADNRIRRWRLLSIDKPRINPLQIARFAHEGPVTHLAVSGPFVVSASTDLTVKVWSRRGLDMLATHGPLADVPASLAIVGGTSGESSPEIRVALMEGSTTMLPLPTSATPPERRVATVQPRLPETDAETTTLPEAEVTGPLPLPAKVEGLVAEAGQVDEFTFTAKAGEQWVIEAAARSMRVPKTEPGKEDAMWDRPSPIDTVVEVRDEAGEPIERVVLEAVRDSYFTFRGKNSTQINDFRVHNWQEMELDELFYSGGEVVKLWLYPTGPDDGFHTYPGFGKRHAQFDTTPVAHALGEPAYIVRPHPPGTELPATGLPVIRLNYRNDDAARQDLGSGSRLTFTAPADGTYRVRLSDARADGGEAYAYTLEVRPRRPDFRPTVAMPDWAKTPLKPGSGRELVVRLMRMDGFDDAIEIAVENLPPGLTAVTTTVEAGQERAWVNLFAEKSATQPTEEQLAALTLVARGTVRGEPVEKRFGDFKSLKIDEGDPNLEIVIEGLPLEDGVPTLTIEPGQTASMRLRITRHTAKDVVAFGKEDAGRNLPHGVFVDNIGLNGLLLLKGQDEREFFITASPIAGPQERMWHLRTNLGGGITSPSVRVRVVAPNKDGVARR